MHELKSNVDRDKIVIKPKFESRYKSLLGDDYETFIDYSLSFLRRSIRVNTLKTTIDDIKNRIGGHWKLEQIPWCKEGFWIEHDEDRRDIGNLIEHMLGYIYVQEAVSMIPPIVLDPQPGDKVLDMCSAPGSKTTQIGTYMKNQGVLVANDVTGDRLKSLGINIQRCGLTNTIINKMPGRFFQGLEFDRILVDAPCSGTGTIRKSLKTLKMWNPVMVKRLAGTQKQLIEAGFNSLRSGGTMVYSTCTLEPEEDEGIINHLLEKFDNAKVEEISLDIKRGKPVTEFEDKVYSDEVKKCLRIWPQLNNTEGFFVAKIKKE